MNAADLKVFPVAGKGHYYEDFEPGLRFPHGRGRTIDSAANTLFNALTVQLGPLYLDAVTALEAGHPNIPLQPWLVFATVFGLSVEDLSEKGGAFLGIDGLTFHKHVYPGATLRAASVVRERRRSEGKPGFGIVTWLTEGVDEDGEQVVSFTRTNLVVAKAAAS